MLIAPGPVGGFAVLGQRIVPHEHHPEIQMGVLSLDRQHLPTIGRLEEALRLKDHSIGEEEVWRVVGLCDVLELLNLVEEGLPKLVQSLSQPLL